MKHYLQKKRESGQAAIEFIVVILVVFFFLLFFLSFGLLMIVSEYMDYATFMAARTFKAGAGDRSNQEANAQIVFEQYAQFVTGNGLARNIQLNFNQEVPGAANIGGVFSSYDLDMFYLPPIFAPNNRFPSRIRLTSEAFLGREPGANECQNFFTQFIQRLSIPNMGRFSEEMDDNGC